MLRLSPRGLGVNYTHTFRLKERVGCQDTQNSHCSLNKFTSQAEYMPTSWYRLKRGSPEMKCKNHQTHLMNHCDYVQNLKSPLMFCLRPEYKCEKALKRLFLSRHRLFLWGEGSLGQNTYENKLHDQTMFSQLCPKWNWYRPVRQGIIVQKKTKQRL